MKDFMRMRDCKGLGIFGYFSVSILKAKTSHVFSYSLLHCYFALYLASHYLLFLRVCWIIQLVRTPQTFKI